MPENNYTEAQVLSLQGIAPEMARDTERIDAARDAGLIWACLGCGSVGGIALHPDLTDDENEKARQETRDHLDPDTFCCPNSDQIIY